MDARWARRRTDGQARPCGNGRHRRRPAFIEAAMIELYTAATPNGFKVSVALEELGLPYKVHPIDIRAGEQFAPDFLLISPNNKIPAILDRDGPGGAPLALFESGAILLYLADKTRRLLATDGPARYAALAWLFFQVGNIGPMFGQAGHFRMYAPEKIPYAIDRYTNEVKRLYGVLDRRLAESVYLAGEEYTVADIANVTWALGAERLGLDLADFPNVQRWISALKARPAVTRGLAVPPATAAPIDDKAREVLFGKTQHQRR
jgi:GST-like protein